MLFKPNMVRMMLDPPPFKTQTRRVMEIQPSIDPDIYVPPLSEKFAGRSYKGQSLAVWPGESEFDFYDCHCPYGAPGDRLYVREAWRAFPEWDSYPPRDITIGAQIEYEAGPKAYDGLQLGRYRHARFMPRKFARVLLEITDVRCERLQLISDNDCYAEGIVGVEFYPDDGFPLSVGYMIGPDDKHTGLDVEPQTPFEKLWDGINGEANPYSANPWVWVVQFKRVYP